MIISLDSGLSDFEMLDEFTINVFALIGVESKQKLN